MSKIIILLFSITFIFNHNCFSQVLNDSSKIDFTFGADISSRYLWRGMELSKSPCIQPSASFSIGNFSISSWSSYTFNNEALQEFDLNISYSIKNTTICINDYFLPNETIANNKYFNYAANKTSHAIEASVKYSSEKTPISLTLGTFIFGADKNYGFELDKDSLDQNYYSSYAELEYSFIIKNNKINAFCGFTPWAGIYGNTLGIVNIGISMSKEIEITDRFSLPIKGMIMANPQSQNIYFGTIISF